jgi:enoyl-CoA hydratase/carnithine racemase
MERLWRELYAFMRALAASSIPIAAAITGHALAGGTVIPLFCDWRVGASGDFKLGLTEVPVGIAMPQFILVALARQVGPRLAERLAVDGQIISPQDALQAGLVDELTAPDQVVERALSWCRNLVALPSQAMLDTRRRARADLVALFDHPEEEMCNAMESWWSEETQRTLKVVVNRLGKKA